MYTMQRKIVSLAIHTPTQNQRQLRLSLINYYQVGIIAIYTRDTIGISQIGLFASAENELHNNSFDNLRGPKRFASLYLYELGVRLFLNHAICKHRLYTAINFLYVCVYTYYEYLSIFSNDNVFYRNEILSSACRLEDLIVTSTIISEIPPNSGFLHAHT